MFPELNLKTDIGSSYAILADNYKYKSNKGNLVKPSKKMLASWLQGVSVLRNNVLIIQEYIIEQYILHLKFYM